ncbi:hypothetical protein [Reinekea sp. G2M2-21]|uniref:hypothetical protein n=1 Tax=Reinekea sp. G2M2-21 TaxID=2788942 RepID=UPI0018A93AA6|nr:hypothetical protein [Reinekea sp. G2M2-21]
MRFRYGMYLNPQDNDPTLDDQVEAENRARELSIVNKGAPVAVWDANDRTLKLFAGYEEFVPDR